MHPFCCSSSVPVSPVAGGSSELTPPTMDPPLVRSDRPIQNSSAGSPPNYAAAGCTNSFRWASRPSFSANLSSIRAFFHDATEVRLNDIVGPGIAGVLHKWVNYGCGWRPRWFVLQDGVLSYYKIRGPDRIQLDKEPHKFSMIIGEDSLGLLSRHQRNGSNSLHSPQRKPVGELHLKVATVKESKSDDRRFSIFTGTKRLHLRAETGEDRTAWMEALQAVKEMFPRISNSELMAPLNNFVVSTEKLRLRLQEEGVSEQAIMDSEQIMRSELAALQGQLNILKQRQLLLTDTLRQLETEKVDLENTLVTESQRQAKEQASASVSRNDNYSEASESEDNNEREDTGEEETEDEEDNAFFDTQDFLSSSSFQSSGTDLNNSETDSDNDEHFGLSIIDVHDPSVSYFGFNYPYVNRRKKLPDPVAKEEGVSLWSMIKDNIGKDLSKVCLPVYFNEPLSLLQKCFEDLEYSYLLDQAYVWGKKGNGLMRILSVAAFAVSGYASTEGRICKPFNPLLGETYEADFPDKGLRFFSEKVSHHPMIVACHCEGTGWKFWADCNLKSKFWGRSIQLDPVGILTLEFDDGEVFRWSKVTTLIYNLILGKLHCDHYGTMRIEGNHGYSCKLKFKEQSIIDRNPHQVHGIVQDRNGKTLATMLGKWDESMHYVYGDSSRNGKGADLSQAPMLWKRSKPPKNPTRYNFTRFAITLNELTPDLKGMLPPTDSRLRKDQRCLENGEFDMANTEKLRLEQRQRQGRTMQESGWKPRWFAKDDDSDTYRYLGGYWEAREKGQWDDCPDIFGPVPS